MPLCRQDQGSTDRRSPRQVVADRALGDRAGQRGGGARRHDQVRRPPGCRCAAGSNCPSSVTAAWTAGLPTLGLLEAAGPSGRARPEQPRRVAASWPRVDRYPATADSSADPGTGPSRQDARDGPGLIPSLPPSDWSSAVDQKKRRLAAPRCRRSCRRFSCRPTMRGARGDSNSNHSRPERSASTIPPPGSTVVRRALGRLPGALQANLKRPRTGPQTTKCGGKMRMCRSGADASLPGARDPIGQE
jgi:hypothetical protein